MQEKSILDTNIKKIFSENLNKKHIDTYIVKDFNLSKNDLKIAGKHYTKPEDIDSLAENLSVEIAALVKAGSKITTDLVEETIQRITGRYNVKVRDIKDFPSKGDLGQYTVACFIPLGTSGTIYFDVDSLNKKVKPPKLNFVNMLNPEYKFSETTFIKKELKNEIKSKPFSQEEIDFNLFIRAFGINAIVHEFTHSLQYNVKERLQFIAENKDNIVFRKARAAFKLFELDIRDKFSLESLMEVEKFDGDIDTNSLLKHSKFDRDSLDREYTILLDKVFQKFGIISDEDKLFVLKVIKFMSNDEAMAYKNGVKALKDFLNYKDNCSDELLSVLYSDIEDFMSARIQYMEDHLSRHTA